MRVRGLLIAVFFALAFAAAAAGMVSLYLKQHVERSAAVPALIPVAVSAHDQAFGRTLTEDDLKVGMFPSESVPKGAVSNPDSLVGKTTKVFLAEGEPVLVTKLSSIGGGLSLSVADSMRAASIQVDKVSGVSGFVLPGDWVDVIAIVKPRSGSSVTRSKTILQRVRVLAAGEKTEQRGKEPITVQAVTLLVNPIGAEKLALAGNEGKIHLALRNPNDSLLVAETQGVSTDELMSGSKPATEEKPKPQPKRPAGRRSTPTPQPKPAKPDSLTIIRGTDASKQPPAMKTPESDTGTPTP